jgi:protease stability complex PrcB-like protein
MVIGAALFIGLAVLQAVVPPVRSLDKGSRSEIVVARQVTIRDQDAWTALWQEHAASRQRPAVDFSSEMVVAVFLGTRPTAGFAAEIVGYRAVDGDLVIQYREGAPPRGAITAQVLTSPFHLVVVPRRTGTVTFEKL